MAVSVAASRDIPQSGRVSAVTSTGQLWAVVWDSAGTSLEFYYSNDDGDTWSQDTAAEETDANAAVAAIFIDKKDQIWLAWASDSNTDMEVKVGTISGNAITWAGSTWVADAGSGAHTLPDIVAFEEGGSDTVVVAFAYQTNVYVKKNTWDGSSFGTGSFLLTQSFQSPTAIGIDFHHTGDDKTVQSSTPHIFVSWLKSADEIKFQRLAYASGSWTPGTLRTPSTVIEGADMYLGTCFDGSVFWMAGLDASGSIDLHSRNAADDTSFAKLTGQPTGGKASADFLDLYYDSSTNDVYVLFVNTSDQPVYAKYDVDGDAWDSAFTLIEAETATRVRFARNEGGGLGAQMLPLWDTGTNVRAEAGTIALNSDPTAPTLNNPIDGSVQDVAALLLVSWDFNDPDPSDSQSAWTLRRRIGTASYHYYNLSSWVLTESASTKINSGSLGLNLSGGWGSDGDNNHHYSVKTWDQVAANPSPWSSENEVIPSGKDNPTITAPSGTVDFLATVTWTVATQTKYRVAVADASGASFGVGNLEYDSSIVVSTATSHQVQFPTDGVTRYIKLQTYNDEGLGSSVAQQSVTVDWDPPSTPTLAVSTTGTEDGVIFVNITNPTPGVGETVTDSNDVFRRVATDGGDGIRIALNVAPNGDFNDYGPLSGIEYEYRAKAVNDSGPFAYSAWTT